LSKANPNNPDIDPPPPPPPPPPPGDLVREQDLVTTAQLRAHASAAARSAQIAYDSAQLVYGSARSYTDIDAAQYASDLMSATRSLKTALEALSSTAGVRDRETIASALTAAVRARTLLDTRTRQCTPSRYCEE